MAKLNMKKIQDSLINRGLAGAAGGAAAKFIGDKIPASVNPLLKNGLTIVAGAILPELSPKTKFLEGVGAGMSGVAGANMISNLMGEKSGVTGLEDPAWTPTPLNGLPMDDDQDLNTEFPVDKDEDPSSEVNGTTRVVLE